MLNTTRKIISLALCMIMAFSLCVVSNVGVSAANDELDYYASVDDTLGPKTSGMNNDFVLQNLSGGGIKMSMSRFGGTFPYVYARNFGSFPGDGFMLSFKDYKNESNHSTYFGYCTFVIFLSPNALDNKYEKFNKGMAAILIDAVAGEVSLIEAVKDSAFARDDPNQKGDPKKEDFYKVKQKILQTDALKAGSLMNKTFNVYFMPAGDDISLCIDIGGNVVSGIIDRKIFNSIPNHPTSSTYVGFTSVDNHYYEWNEWGVKFLGHKILTEGQGVVTVADENIRYIGRWTNDGKTAKAYYQSGLELKVNGSFLRVKTDKSIIASVDNGEWKKYSAGMQTLFESIKSGEHTIKIMSPYENTNPKISGFYGDAEIKTLPLDSDKTIMFIGGSETAGYATKDKKYEKSVAGNYALQTAKRLGYSLDVVAGDALSNPENFFKKGEPSSDAKNKSFKADYDPKCIVVCLSNTDKYQSFIEKLRDTYPDSVIVCMTSISGKNTDTVKNIVSALQKGGDKRVFCVNTSGWNIEKCADGNPTQDGHKTMASKLTAAIKSILSGKLKVPANQKPTTNKNDSDGDVDVETDVDTEEIIVEEIVSENNLIYDYLWLLITAGAVAVLALVTAIFWPKVKKIFVKK